MPNLEDFDKLPRRVLHIFYVLDTSGSMTGEAIAMLNRAMEETTEVLKQQAKTNADAQIKIAVLEFNTVCSWVQKRGPEDIEDFIWEDLEAGGTTELATVLNELNDKMSKNKFLNSMTGSYIPVVIFMTDGCATDDYEKKLKEIRNNKWFSRATKIGFAIGDADMKMISEVVGNSEAVIRTTDLSMFAKLIKFTSATASMLCSTSTTSTDAVSGASIVNLVKKDVPGVPDDINMTDISYDKDPDADWSDDDWN